MENVEMILTSRVVIANEVYEETQLDIESYTKEEMISGFAKALLKTRWDAITVTKNFMRQSTDFELRLSIRDMDEIKNHKKILSDTLSKYVSDEVRKDILNEVSKYIFT